MTQQQIYEAERRKIAALDQAFMDLVTDPENPLTRQDLERLIALRPQHYARFKCFLNVLK